MNFDPNDLLVILPLVFLAGWATLLLLVHAFLPEKHKDWTITLAATGLIITFVLSVLQWGNSQSAFGGMVQVDGFAVFINLLVVGGGFFSILLARDYLKRIADLKGEYFILLLFSVVGMMLMGMASDLIVVFLALELLSIPLYVLAGFFRNQGASQEAGLKYFLLGAFAGGFVLYGIALVYGAAGSTNLAEIATAVDLSKLTEPAYLLAGAGLILVGFGFKVAVVPFHMWTPDVYQGSPTSSTAFMAVGAKVAGFAALLRIFVSIFAGNSVDLVPILYILVGLTLLVGNITAVAQKNIKRMLAYSSISHAGFILMSLIPYSDPTLRAEGVASALFYLLSFAVVSFGSWAVVMLLEKKEGKGLLIEDYAGLGKKYPLLAVVMLVFMLSFTGVPPTIGFAGKFFIFRNIIEAQYYGLAVLAVIMSLVSAYYYLRVVIVMYMQDGDPEIADDRWTKWIALGSGLAAIVLFLFTQPLYEWASQAIITLVN